eukprot:COSAG04_NODE_4082_length_2316_cov_41.215607_1_plen_72_part_00
MQPMAKDPVLRRTVTSTSEEPVADAATELDSKVLPSINSVDSAEPRTEIEKKRLQAALREQADADADESTE